MTYAFLEDFEDRKRQVRHYLAVVLREERGADLGASHVQQGRLLTLRAGTFLVLYNLIEATMRAAIQAIHDKITTSSVPFPALTPSLRKEAIRLFKKGADPVTDHTMVDFPAAFVTVALQQDIKMSGTVDAKAIRELSQCYGFSAHTNAAATRNGSDLLTVKRNRNDLAHGLKSFEEVGRDYTALELALLTRRATSFMGDILKNIGAYLDAEDYLETGAVLEESESAVPT
jgi:MAE_28990/MAE_18760-like HEPN